MRIASRRCSSRPLWMQSGAFRLLSAGEPRRTIRSSSTSGRRATSSALSCAWWREGECRGGSSGCPFSPARPRRDAGGTPEGRPRVRGPRVSGQRRVLPARPACPRAVVVAHRVASFIGPAQEGRARAPTGSNGRWLPVPRQRWFALHGLCRPAVWMQNVFLRAKGGTFTGACGKGRGTPAAA